MVLHLDGISTVQELLMSREDISSLSTAIRDMDRDAGSMEEIAQRVTGHLYENILIKSTGERALALVRFFKTQPYGDLPPSLQRYVLDRFPETAVQPNMQCLTLMASTGAQPEWNSRFTSQEHQAVPLKSPEIVERSPMICQLFLQFGIDLKQVIEPDPSVLVSLDEKTYNVFYLENALGSPYVIQQEQFVNRYGIRSVLGFGGMLPLGSVFAVVLFSTASVKKEIAQLFIPLALSAKIALLPFAGKQIFSR
jgi:hypothetical protein